MIELLPIVGAIGGAIVGSFLATLILRWPNGMQASRGRSRCDHCHRALPPASLVPIFSYLLAQGRCRFCRGRINPTHFQVELAAAALTAFAFVLRPDLTGVALATFWLLLLAPAILDARHFWLPDRLTIVLAVAGAALGGLVSGHTLTSRLVGGLVAFVSLWGIAEAYRGATGRRGLGKGDPKLFGAIGLWTGWIALPVVLLLASAVGLATAIALGRGRGDKMPFGTMLAVGGGTWAGLAAAGLL